MPSLVKGYVRVTYAHMGCKCNVIKFYYSSYMGIQRSASGESQDYASEFLIQRLNSTEIQVACFHLESGHALSS
jgi:hypothetical protein